MNSVELVSSSNSIPSQPDMILDSYSWVNGTLQSGQIIEVSYKFTECYGDSRGGVNFHFTQSAEEIAIVYVTVDIINEGDRRCGA